MDGFLIMVYSFYNYYPLYLIGTMKEALDVCHSLTEKKIISDIKETFEDTIKRVDYVCIIEFKNGRAEKEEVIITEFPSII